LLNPEKTDPAKRQDEKWKKGVSPPKKPQKGKKRQDEKKKGHLGQGNPSSERDGPGQADGGPEEGPPHQRFIRVNLRLFGARRSPR